MGLLDGQIAELFANAFGGLYLDGTLHAGTGEPVYAANGDLTGYTDGGDTAIKVQTDRVSEQVKASDGYASGDVALIVLAHGKPTITTDHEITDGYGTKYRVMDVDMDAARSHWILRGRPSG